MQDNIIDVEPEYIDEPECTAMVKTSNNIVYSDNPEINSSLVRVNDMLCDFDKIRDIILENINQAKNVAELVQNEIYIGGETNPELISSYTTLISAINSSLKILTSGYKDVSKVLNDLKKLEHNKPETIINNFTITSTTDVVNNLRNMLENTKSK